jgi:hypothetical protein
MGFSVSITTIQQMSTVMDSDDEARPPGYYELAFFRSMKAYYDEFLASHGMGMGIISSNAKITAVPSVNAAEILARPERLTDENELPPFLKDSKT